MTTSAIARRRWQTLAAKVGVLAALTWMPRSAVAEPDDTKQACVRAHESAQVLRRDGKLRASREELLRCRQLSCPEIVRSTCDQWLEEVDASIPTVVFEARDRKGQPVSVLRVMVDGSFATARLDGRAMAIDPGEHVVRFESMYGSLDVPILVAEGQKNRLVVGDFGVPAAGAEPPRLAPTPFAPRAPAQPVSSPRQRTIGIVVGALGLTSLGAGAGFGGLAIATAHDAKCEAPCPPTDASGAPNPALESARSAYDRAHAFAWASNVTLAVGLVAAAVGGYLIFSGSPPRSSSPSAVRGTP